MASRVSKDCDHIAPIDSHYVPQEITDSSAQQVGDAFNVPFLIPASELQERKNKRRKKPFKNWVPLAP